MMAPAAGARYTGRMQPMNERTVDHVGIAVASLDEALPVWEALVGAPGTGREVVEAQGVEVVFVGAGAARIELLAPTRADSPVAKFLERRGSGLHHVCYRVPDIRAALAELSAAGFDLVDREPRAGAHGHQVAFLHPRSTTGVLVELLQPS
jgi:methylmalonyl-CoA/ethylmalonyl-CoA epimerase